MRAKPLAIPSEKKRPGGILDQAASARAEIERVREFARAWIKTIPETRRSDSAVLFARQALVAFAERASPACKLNAFIFHPFGKLDKAAVALAGIVATEAGKLPLPEALHVITSFYPSLIPTRERGLLGAFYTPPALANRLLDMVEDESLDWRHARVLDPAVGGGAFLILAAQRMRRAIESSEPAFILAQLGSRLLGLELDPRAASLAQTAMEILLSDLSLSAGRPVPTMVRVCDTLNEHPAAAFDLVVGNPPYGRVALSGDQRRRYERSLYGHANLYGVFTDIALRWTKPGGLIAYLTPTSFLAGRYYSALRGLLASEAPPVAIDFVHARAGVFEDVLQETLLAVYAKGAKANRAQIHHVTLTSDREAQFTRNGTIGLPEPATAPWLAPREPAHSQLITRVETMKTRLSDWGYSVSTGPLVWNRFKPQLRLKAGGKDVYPLLWAECVTSDGRFVYRAAKKNHEPYFKLEAGDNWLLVKEPCVLVQRTTAKEQSRRLIAAELPASFIAQHGGVVVENHLNMIRADDHVKVSPGVVSAILNSRVVDQVFRCMSGSVAVSAFELASMPLPKASDLEILSRLVALGADREDIEAECARLYGAT